MGIVRSWVVDWRGANVLLRRNRSTAKRTANPQLDSGWSVSRALGCTTSAESDGNLKR